MPAADDPIAFLPGLSPVIEARFDEALMSSDGGLLALPDVLPPASTIRGQWNASCIRSMRSCAFVC